MNEKDYKVIEIKKDNEVIEIKLPLEPHPF
jgi:hypothetical protein